MSKVAIFTEGQTEQIFVRDMVQFLANERRLHVLLERIGGGRRCELYIMHLHEVGDREKFDHHVLIVDVSNDERVISAINDRYRNLREAGYDAILAIRDLYPDFRPDQKQGLLLAMRAALLNGGVDTTIHLSVVEIEAWFLAELGQLERLDPRLNQATVREWCGIELGGFSEDIEHPSDVLDQIYKLVDLRYEKRRDQVEAITARLDFAAFLEDAGERAPGARALLVELSGLLA